MLLPPLHDPSGRRAVRFPDGELSYAELRARADAVATALGDGSGAPVAVWAEPTLATVVGVVGALAAGRAVLPISPRAGEGELGHIVGDARPDVLLAPGDAEIALDLPRLDPLALEPAPAAATPPAAEVPDSAAALVIYTSGTTGPPKGVVLSRGALAANLDALAELWGWTGDDEVVQALPLFHVHGLVLGVLGPLRRGGSVTHLGRFDAQAVAAALASGGTMLFAVPTMYHRLAAVAAEDTAVAQALGGARLLVSGSAALAAELHDRLTELTGQAVVERYGMSETLMIASTLPGAPQPGRVGFAVPGVEIELRDDDGAPVPADDATVGAVWVRGPSLLSEYLNLPEASASALRDGWFETGDLGTFDAARSLRLVGRRSTDLIKSGGFRIGAGEIEGALLEHPAVDQAAVLGLPDDDLGERIVAWIVPAAGAERDPDALIAHVAQQLAPYKRPREVRYVDDLPRNAMGKVQKRLLVD
ncbi:AMP-binding protein [Conexibacter woesei]|uniref:AMP-binding protein n=1 Tax=Conexibacter woesei TaxID=191495 RepID=UPI0003FD81D6|nr:AMP-binding protein [Conexibacter woesei]